MEAVVVSFAVFEKERRRQNLACVVAAFQEIIMSLRIVDINARRNAPTVGEGRKTGIENSPEIGDNIGQRISKVLVFSPAEAVTRHDNAAAKKGIVRIEIG